MVLVFRIKSLGLRVDGCIAIYTHIQFTVYRAASLFVDKVSRGSLCLDVAIIFGSCRTWTCH